MQYVLVYSIEIFESQQKTAFQSRYWGTSASHAQLSLEKLGFHERLKRQARSVTVGNDVSTIGKTPFVKTTLFWVLKLSCRTQNSDSDSDSDLRCFESLKLGEWNGLSSPLEGFMIPTWVLRYSKLVSLKVLAWVCGDLVGLVSWKKSWATLTDALDAKVRICFSLQFFDFGKTISIERNFFICGTCRVAVAWGRITLVLRHHAGSVGDHPFATSQSPVRRVVGSDLADPRHCFASFAQPLAFHGFGKIKERFPSFCCLAGGGQFKFQWFHFSQDPSCS